MVRYEVLTMLIFPTIFLAFTEYILVFSKESWYTSLSRRWWIVSKQVFFYYTLINYCLDVWSSYDYYTEQPSYAFILFTFIQLTLGMGMSYAFFFLNQFWLAFSLVIVMIIVFVIRVAVTWNSSIVAGAIALVNLLFMVYFLFVLWYLHMDNLDTGLF